MRSPRALCSAAFWRVASVGPVESVPQGEILFEMWKIDEGTRKRVGGYENLKKREDEKEIVTSKGPLVFGRRLRKYILGFVSTSISSASHHLTTSLNSPILVHNQDMQR